MPSTEFQLPTRRAPAPSWAAQPSVMPAITGVPSGMPVTSADSAQTVPSGVPDRTTSGSIAAGTPSSARTSCGQVSLRRS